MNDGADKMNDDQRQPLVLLMSIGGGGEHFLSFTGLLGCLPTFVK